MVGQEMKGHIGFHAPFKSSYLGGRGVSDPQRAWLKEQGSTVVLLNQAIT